ncbi:MAG: GIY-YIG nuclease family protein [Chitinivibrionia bacterium]|nr:GIY-YIG nuclease family protein [Chitinivibrionia bacterium]
MENENKTLIDKIRDEIILRNGLAANEIAAKFLGIKKESPVNFKLVEKIFKDCREFYFDGEKWQIKNFSHKWEKAQFGVEDFEKEPQSFGVFGFYDENKKVIFVGSAKNLREKLLSFCEKSDEISENIKKLRELAVSYIVSICKDENSALETERKLIAKHKPVLN